MTPAQALAQRTATTRRSPTRTLVLNAGYEPLSVVSFRRALVLVMNNRAVIVEADSDNPVWTVAGPLERPTVIVLTRYVKLPNQRSIPVSRRGVLRRDGARCAYCQGHATTIDHVIPRSRGGEDSWENLVACCLGCNNLKGDRTPKEMGWRMHVAPRQPYGTAWMVRGMDRPQPHWEEYLAWAA
jgi:5-methylcytosine-specific restriction endonuclease McrA